MAKVFTHPKRKLVLLTYKDEYAKEFTHIKRKSELTYEDELAKEFTHTKRKLVLLTYEDECANNGMGNIQILIYASPSLLIPLTANCQSF